MGSRLLLTICALCFSSVGTYLAISLGYVPVIQVEFLSLPEQILVLSGVSLPLFFWFSTYLRRPY